MLNYLVQEQNEILARIRIFEQKEPGKTFTRLPITNLLITEYWSLNTDLL